MNRKRKVTPASEKDFGRILEVWEASVRATHDFLAPEHIDMFRPIVLEKALPAVALRVLRNAGEDIVAFAGVAEDKLEMLFVHPAELGKGLGRQLLEHMVDEFGITLVDVNEQNEKAVGFYQHMGFEKIGRSSTDGMGLPYPLIHLALKKKPAPDF